MAHVLVISDKTFPDKKKRMDYYNQKYTEILRKFPFSTVQIYFSSDCGAKERIERYRQKHAPTVLEDQ